MKNDSIMENQMHLAAQYLAAAGISFLDQKNDDSHTNLGFNTDNGCLYTHTLSENEDTLCLDYEQFSLEWKSNQGTTSFGLDGATHAEIVNWLSEVAHTFLNKAYQYKFHYNLPYTISDAYTFKLVNENQLFELMHLRILAQFTLEHIVKDNDLQSSVRIWPHHFDTATYANFSDNSHIAIGFGLAIPDAICNQHYMYISGYKDNEIIDASSYKKLNIGQWKGGAFKGAILPATNITEAEAITFFQEAIHHFKNH